MCVGRGERNQEKVISSLAVGQLARKQKAMLAAVMEAMRLWWAGKGSRVAGGSARRGFSRKGRPTICGCGV